MNNLQALSDKSAIGLSLLCTLHCLAMPLAVVLLPSIAALPLADETFHYWMLLAVLPISAYALTMIGAVLMALGHAWNYRLCQAQDCDGCDDLGEPDEQADSPW